MSSAMQTGADLVDRTLGSSWEVAVDTHAPAMWRRLLAQAPYWQAVDASDVTWLRLADLLGEAPVGDLGVWLDRSAQDALVQVRESPWRTPSVPLGVLGDEPPAQVTDGALNAIRFRLNDVTIARPSPQPGLMPATDRGMDIPWRAEGDVVVSPAASWERTFEIDDVLIDLVLFAERERRLVGMVRGADLTAVSLRTQDGERVCGYESSGLFRALDVPEGPISVVLDFESEHEDRRVVTQWRAL